MIETHEHLGPADGGYLETYLGRDITDTKTRLRYEDFTWDPGAAIPNGVEVSTTFTLARAGVPTGVECPQGIAGEQYEWGLSQAAAPPVFRQNGNHGVTVGYLNGTGGNRSPGSKTWRVYFLFQEALS